MLAQSGHPSRVFLRITFAGVPGAVAGRVQMADGVSSGAKTSGKTEERCFGALPPASLRSLVEKSGQGGSPALLGAS
ncbi:MAG TPA: hypothetical protein VNN22_26430 [Verrucomicrobiae bacterium]|nr:hypothetical protein [Verrucomicrobiae bacterium]